VQVAVCLLPVATFSAMVLAPDAALDPLRWVLYASCVATVVVMALPVARPDRATAVLAVVGALAFGGGAAYLHSLDDEPAAIPLAGGLVFFVGAILLVVAACAVVAEHRHRLTVT
jgi:uncharacterized membrane protein YgdD (TMEM256/DUF423 family)